MAAGSAGSAATSRSRACRWAPTSPRRAASQAATWRTWVSVAPAAGSCARAARASASRPAAIAQSSRAPPDGDVFGPFPRQASSHFAASSSASERMARWARPSQTRSSSAPGAGVVEEGAHRIHRGGLLAQVHVETDELDGPLRGALARLAEPSPVRLDQALPVLDAALERIDDAQVDLEGGGIDQGVGHGLLDHPLGIAQPAAADLELHQPLDRPRGERRAGGTLDQASAAAWSRAGLLADAQQVSGLVPAGPPRPSSAGSARHARVGRPGSPPGPPPCPDGGDGPPSAATRPRSGAAPRRRWPATTPAFVVAVAPPLDRSAPGQPGSSPLRAFRALEARVPTAAKRAGHRPPTNYAGMPTRPSDGPARDRACRHRPRT